MGERLDDALLPVELDLLQRILALVDLPVDRLIEHAPEELQVAVERSLAAGLLEDLVALLHLHDLEPGPQLLDVVGRDVGEVGDVDRVKELEDLLHPSGFLVRGGWLRIPGPVKVLQGELVNGDVLFLSLGQEFVLDIPCLLDG